MTETAVTIVVGLGSGLLGSILGFLGALYLENRRDAMRRRAEVLTVMLEMAELESTLEAALEDRMRLRETLQRDAWERFHPDLVNWLPLHLVKLLHLHQDNFETVRASYQVLAGHQVSEEARKGIAVTFWAHIYRSERLREWVKEALTSAQRTLWFKLFGVATAAKEDAEAFGKLYKELEARTIEFIRSKGLEPGRARPLRDTIPSAPTGSQPEEAERGSAPRQPKRRHG